MNARNVHLKEKRVIRFAIKLLNTKEFQEQVKNAMY